jgi:hypothetical protein
MLSGRTGMSQPKSQLVKVTATKSKPASTKREAWTEPDRADKNKDDPYEESYYDEEEEEGEYYDEEEAEKEDIKPPNQLIAKAPYDPVKDRMLDITAED